MTDSGGPPGTGRDALQSALNRMPVTGIEPLAGMKSSGYESHRTAVNGIRSGS